MPIREFRCPSRHTPRVEVIHASLDPEKVPPPVCACGTTMELLVSIPRIDTSATFHSFNYRGPDGRKWSVDNLHTLRAIEHTYHLTGHDVRFDAYSAEPSNPDTVDGFGQPYRTGEKDEQPSSKTVDLGS